MYLSLAQAGGFRGVAGMSDELVSTVWRDDMREVMIWLFSGWHGIAVALCILAGCACWDVTRSRHWSYLHGIRVGLVGFASALIGGGVVRLWQ